MSIVQALIEQVDAEVAQASLRGPVIGLDLTIGRLSGVHVDSIRFAFELLSPGTIVAGAELRIAQPRPRVVCHACGAQTEVEQIELQCPACGSDRITIEGGAELLLQSIELARRVRLIMMRTSMTPITRGSTSV